MTIGLETSFKREKIDFPTKVYKSRFEFLRKKNHENLKGLNKLEKIIAIFTMALNYPISYCISYLVLRYSPKNKGYVEEG